MCDATSHKFFCSLLTSVYEVRSHIIYILDDIYIFNTNFYSLYLGKLYIMLHYQLVVYKILSVQFVQATMGKHLQILTWNLVSALEIQDKNIKFHL